MSYACGACELVTSKFMDYFECKWRKGYSARNPSALNGYSGAGENLPPDTPELVRMTRQKVSLTRAVQPASGHMHPCPGTTKHTKLRCGRRLSFVQLAGRMPLKHRAGF